jgi:iron complex outermembrane recepter protein
MTTHSQGGLNIRLHCGWMEGSTRQWLLLGSACGLLAAALPAGAQESAPAAAPAATGTVEEIVVTATRAAAAGFSAPTPTTVVNSADLERKQVTDVADLLNEIPAFKPSTDPGSNGVKTQLPGANLADLRGLGPNRTLVLVDGMRVVPQAPANNTGTGVSPDLDQIPTLMVERVEVVTGGASAQWGSDAVAGVVNVRLRKQFDGVEFTTQGGISEYGDAGNVRAALLAGKNLFDDRLHIVGAVDFSKLNEVGDIYSRPWGRQEYQIVSNPAAATNGLPVNLVVPDVHIYSAPGMLITGPASFPYRNYTFGPNGSVTPFQTGSLVSGTTMIGGQGESQALGLSLIPGIRRVDPYVRVQYDVSDSVRVFAVASYSMLHAELNPLPSRITGGTIHADNAYLDAEYPAVAAALGPNGSFTFNRVNYDFSPTGVNGPTVTDNKTPHAAVGAEGDLGTTWHWDSHVGWGQNVYTNATYGDGIKQHETYATDAVLYNGQIACRALVPGSATYNPTAAAGCVPINLFGVGSPSAAALAYVVGTARATATYDQTSAAANIHGEPVSTWAGPVSTAAGIEYRRESENVTTDAISAAGGYEIANAAPFNGAFDVKEGYLETIAPLLSDSPFGKSLDLNAAARLADYSTVGDQTTWKAGLTYQPVQSLRLRATRSRDIRAPALFELYSPGSVANNSVSVRNPATGITYTNNIPVNITEGNPNLRPETAESSTAGFVVEPTAVPGFSLSADYYDINLKDAITSQSTVGAASLCNAGDTFYCRAFTFSPSGPPTALTLGVQNLADVRVEGIDAAVAYRSPLSRWAPSLPGNIEASLLSTYTRHVWVNTGTGSPAIDRAGENSSINTYALPRDRSDATLTYNLRSFSGTAQISFISAGTIDNTYNTTPALTSNLNHVPAITYLNLFSSYDVAEHFQVFGSVHNVFNRQPPPVPNVSLNVATNGEYYDTIGRAFELGLRLRF